MGGLEVYGPVREMPSAWATESGELYFGFGSRWFSDCNGQEHWIRLEWDNEAADPSKLSRSALTILASSLCWLPDFFLLPSPALVLSIELIPGAFLQVMSPLGAFIQSGTNNVSLGVPWGFTRLLSFALQDANGQAGTEFTIKIIQAPVRTSANWSVVVTTPDSVVRRLNNSSPLSDGQILLPGTAAGGTALLSFTLAGGATILSAALSVSLFLGTGTTYAWTVQSEDGKNTSSFGLTFIVPPLSHNASWTALITLPSRLPGFVVSVNQSSSAVAVVKLPPQAAGSTALISFSLALGTSLVPPSSAVNVTLGVRGSVGSYSFQVWAPDGTSSGRRKINLQVALSSQANWTLTISHASISSSLILTDRTDPSLTSNKLPYTAAYSVVSLQLSLADGATVSPNFSPALALGARGSNYTYAGKVTSEDASASSSISFTVSVGLSPLANWTLSVQTSSGVRSFSSNDGRSIAPMQLPYTDAATLANVSITAADGASFLTNPASPSLRLGARGSNMIFVLNITSENGGTQSSFILAMHVALSLRNDWSLSIDAVGGSALFDSSTAVGGIGRLSLPSISASTQATLSFTIADGARLSPPFSHVVLTLGGRGSTTNYSFRCVAEDGTAGPVFNVSIFVALSSVRWFELLIRAPGLADTLLSQDDSSTPSYTLPYTSALSFANLSFTLPDGASLLVNGSVAASLEQLVPLGPTGSSVQFQFNVPSEDGGMDSRAGVVITFRVAASEDHRITDIALSSMRNWTVLIRGTEISSVLLTNRSSSAAGVFHLSPASAHGSELLKFSLPPGATLIPSNLTAIVQLGSCGSVTNYTFICRTESGVASQPYTLSFQVALQPDPQPSFLQPPTSYRLGSVQPLQLQVKFTGSVSAAVMASMRYTLTLISVPDLTLGLAPTVVISSSNSSLLQVDDNWLDGLGGADALTFELRVQATDTLPEHVSVAGVQPSGSVSTRVQIFPAIQLQLQVPDATVDPCSGSMLCSNGGACVATLDSVSTASTGVLTYSLSCACASYPVAYYGLTCDFAILECPSCVSSFLGASPMTLYGLMLTSLVRLRIAERVVPFSVEAVDVNNLDAEAAGVLQRQGSDFAERLQRVQFQTPSLISVNRSVLTSSVSPRLPGRELMASSDGVNPVSAYEQVTLNSNLPGRSLDGTVELNLTHLLYYSSSSCIAVGEWKEDGLGGCVQCPPGGYWSVGATSPDTFAT
jgi:hypothetical protein